MLVSGTEIATFPSPFLHPRPGDRWRGSTALRIVGGRQKESVCRETFVVAAAVAGVECCDRCGCGECVCECRQAAGASGACAAGVGGRVASVRPLVVRGPAPVV